MKGDFAWEEEAAEGRVNKRWGDGAKNAGNADGRVDEVGEGEAGGSIVALMCLSAIMAARVGVILLGEMTGSGAGGSGRELRTSLFRWPSRLNEGNAAASSSFSLSESESAIILACWAFLGVELSKVSIIERQG